MTKRPISEDFKNAGKLNGKVAVITGAHSDIGRIAAVAYALEGGSVAI